MAFKTTFRRLFALKIRHNFFLDGQNGVSFYAMSDEDKKLKLANFDVRKEFFFMPTKQSEHILKTRHLRWSADEEGFFVGIEMDPLSIDKPFLPFLESESVVFSIHTNNRLFSNFTNMPLATKDVLPFRFYFTNDNAANKTTPSVSNPLKPNEIRNYEMGECIRLPTGETWEAIKNNTGFDASSGAWRLFSGNFYQYVNTSDRQALPKRFSLQFDKIQVKSIVAELKDAAGVSLKKLNFTSKNPLKSVDFDFSSFVNDITEGGNILKINTPIRDGTYLLSISGDYKLAEQKVFLFDALESKDCLGIVQIVHKAGLKDGFRIQNNDKTLPTVMPIFEIRFQSRLTYRLYLDNTRKAIFKEFNAVKDAEFDYKEAVLTRKKADRLARSPLHLKLDSGLALPEANTIRLVQNKEQTEFFTEIAF